MAEPHGQGSIAGFLLRVVRESMPRTQTQLAESLGVDVTTVQGWESGRRPLGNVKAGAFLEIRRRLVALGGTPELAALMEAALDADRIVACTKAGVGDDEHPLRTQVLDRDTTHLVVWALNGTPPPLISRMPARARRGPVPTAPQLPTAERAALFDHLRDAAEAAGRPGRSESLLRRQAVYLCSYDPHGRSWTLDWFHARRDLLSTRGWSPGWAESRSVATALARQGDRLPLMDFIDRAMSDEDGEAANLNYWAYWIGLDPRPRSDDGFMADRQLTGWDPVALGRYLVGRLDVSFGYVDLYAHSMSALLAARPWILDADPGLRVRLRECLPRLLDGAVISVRSREELGRVHYRLQRTH